MSSAWKLLENIGEQHRLPRHLQTLRTLEVDRSLTRVLLCLQGEALAARSTELGAIVGQELLDAIGRRLSEDAVVSRLLACTANLKRAQQEVQELDQEGAALEQQLQEQLVTDGDTTALEKSLAKVQAKKQATTQRIGLLAKEHASTLRAAAVHVQQAIGAAISEADARLSGERQAIQQQLEQTLAPLLDQLAEKCMRADRLQMAVKPLSSLRDRETPSEQAIRLLRALGLDVAVVQPEEVAEAVSA